MTGLSDEKEDSSSNEPLSFYSSRVIPDWLATCDDVDLLEQYIEACQKVVEAQLQIEEKKRSFEITLQDMQDEVWNASNNPLIGQDGETVSPLTAAASALGLNTRCCNSSDDESESSPLESLSVSPRKKQTDEKNTVNSPLSPASHEVEVEKFRNDLEANLYLSLRVSAEVDDCEYRNMEKAKVIDVSITINTVPEHYKLMTTVLWYRVAFIYLKAHDLYFDEAF